MKKAFMISHIWPEPPCEYLCMQDLDLIFPERSLMIDLVSKSKKIVNLGARSGTKTTPNIATTPEIMTKENTTPRRHGNQDTTYTLQ